MDTIGIDAARVLKGHEMSDEELLVEMATDGFAANAFSNGELCVDRAAEFVKALRKARKELVDAK